MIVEYSDITINGKHYSADDLKELLKNPGNQDNIGTELKEIFGFIRLWINDSDSIPVRTSGSTGEPKIVDLKKQNMINSAKMTEDFFGLNADQTALLCLPTDYIAGKMMIVRAFVTGFNLITVKPSSKPLSGLTGPIPDFIAMTPYQLFYSLDDLQNSKKNKIIIGGGEIQPELEHAIRNISSEIYATYGMTETCSHVALRKVNGTDSSPIYHAGKSITFKQDDRGCLVINAPMLSSVEIVTNDVVDLQNSESFKWIGRIDNVINSGGIKIFPEDIEKKISGMINFPYLACSLPDKVLKERVSLLIECENFSKGDKGKLMKKMQEVLSKYEIPKEIIGLKKFCYSGSGKILRKETSKLAFAQTYSARNIT